jgi:Endonuclease/Exonuclease/phosphatase family.
VVRIGTWNLENLFRPEDEDGPRDPAAYEAKLAALAGVIARIQPDVLAVQEVGNPAPSPTWPNGPAASGTAPPPGWSRASDPSGSATCPGSR